VLESAGPPTGHEGLEWAEPLTKHGGLASAGEPVLEPKLEPEPWLLGTELGLEQWLLGPDLELEPWLLGHGLESWPCVS